MAERLKGKSAAVTGGGGGIGRAICLAMAEAGAKVVVNDIGRNPDGTSMADKVVSEIKTSGAAAVANYDSVATMAGGQNIIKDAMSNFGRIDILVNCAGNFKLGGVADLSESDWDSIIAVHLKGHFSCTQSAVKEMIKQKSGRIINISSTGAFWYAPGPITSVAYGAAKAGIMGMTASMSANLKQYNITVNALLPGAITTLFPALTAGKGFGVKKREGPEFVAPTVVYLASDESQNITGEFIYSAGGELGIFNRPIQMPGPHCFVRKQGKWTVDEIAEVLPTMLA